MGLETLTGSLAAGKSADFIVLGQPLQEPRRVTVTTPSRNERKATAAANGTASAVANTAAVAPSTTLFQRYP